MKTFVMHFLVGMKVIKVESVEEFTKEEAIDSIRDDYPTETISFIHPSKVCLFT